MRQRDRLLNWMLAGGRVTRLSAVNDFGLFELSARMGEIEQTHTVSRKKIKVMTRHSGMVPVMEYWIDARYSA
jgi:hypothetical protein